MKLNRLSVKRLCLLIGAGALLSMLAITITFYALTGNELFFLMGAALMICALFWLFLLVLFFGKRLSLFTSELCQTSVSYTHLKHQQHERHCHNQQLILPAMLLSF